jgi:hypothetical protein
VCFPHARLREELLNLTYEVGPAGVRVIDKGKIHQDHAVVVRGICAGLQGPGLRPFGFSCGNETLIVGPDPQPVAASVPLAPGVLAPVSAQPDLAAQVKAIRDKPLCQRSQEETAIVEQYFAEQARRFNSLDPLSRAAQQGGYLPTDGDSAPDVETEVQGVRDMFQRWR